MSGITSKTQRDVYLKSLNLDSKSPIYSLFKKISEDLHIVDKKLSAILDTIVPLPSFDFNPPNTEEDPLHLIDLVDDFITSNGGVATATGPVGGLFNLNWTLLGGTNTVQTGSLGHPGITRLQTLAAINNVSSLSLGSTAGHGVFAVRETSRIVYITAPVTGVSYTARYGLFSNIATVGGSQGVYFTQGPAAANWQFLTVDGVGTTTTNTGIAVTAGNWYKLEIIHPQDDVYDAYINDQLVASHNTNIFAPAGAGATNIGMHIETTTAAQKSVDIDYFRWQSRVINYTERYT